MKHLRYLLIIILLAFNSLSHAQKPDLRFERITDESGRSLGFITGIVQDTTGFMWISTRSGLYRYDGYNYRVFRNDREDSTSLPFNDITNLFYDDDGMFWMKHYDRYIAFSQNQLDTNYQHITGRQFHFSAEIAQGKDGGIWIGPTPEGLYHFNKDTSAFKLYRKANSLYRQRAYNFLDSMNSNAEPIAGLEKMGNNLDTVVQFSLKEATDIFIGGVGELDEYGRYDYGRLMKGDSVIWEMTYGQTKYAGGVTKNRVQMEAMVLSPGKYSLHYTSDNSHAHNDWNGAQPDKSQLYGIQLFKISSATFRQLQEKIIQSYIPANTITTNEFDAIYADNAGRMLIASNAGIDVYNPENKEFHRQTVDYKKLLNMNNPGALKIHALYQTRDGMYWIGTSHGLLRFNFDTKGFKVYRNQGTNNDVLTDNQIYAIKEDRKGLLWLGSADGLNVLNRQSGDIYHYYSNVKNRLFDNRVIDFYEDHSGNMWLATPEGLNRLKQRKFFFVDMESEGYTSYPKVLNEQTNSIWYRGKDNILYKYNRTKNQYRKYPLKEKFFPYDDFTEAPLYTFHDLLVDEQNRVWIAIENKLIRFDEEKQEAMEVALIDPIILEDDTITNGLNTMIDQGNLLWLFALDGIYKYNKAGGRVIEFFDFNRDYGDEVYSINDFVKAVEVHPDGNFWIRSVEGIFRFKPDQGEMELVHAFDEDVRFSSATNGSIHIDKQGNVWIPFLPSIIKYNYDQAEKELIEIKGIGDVGRCDVTAGNDSTLWIYTNNGLFRFKPDNREITHFTNEDNLADNDINDMVDDGRGNLWITSSRGLTRYNKSDETFATVSDEFVSQRFVRISKANYESRGELLFFTRNGYYSYFPDSINSDPPNVVVTSFRLYGEEVRFDSLSHQKRRIVLNYNENFFTFEFAALDYTDPASNNYKYMLDGLDKVWYKSGAGNRQAPYTSVPPGDYVFRLKGSNNDGVWSKKETQIHVEVIPPIWKRPWAYVVYVVVAVLSAISYIRWRERNLQREKRILEMKVAERTEEIERQKEELAKQRDIATQQRDQIAKQKQNITDSIMYARRIQNAVLPPEDFIDDILPDHFILNRPRDIVSGDYYWMTQRGRKTYIVAADCTGHGVPGAFMSMLGVAFLNEIVNRSDMHHADEILNELRAYVMKSLHQTGKDNEAKDGMDLAFCIIDSDSMQIEYSGAFNPLYVIREGELIKMKGDRMPIGIYFRNDMTFTNHVMDIKHNDTLYMFSDGYVDQFGGKDGRKFMAKKFQQLLLEIHKRPMPEQKIILENRLDRWMDGYEQVDDILVVGVRIREKDLK